MTVQGAGSLNRKQGWVSGLVGSHQLMARDAGHGSLDLGGSKSYSCPMSVPEGAV